MQQLSFLVNPESLGFTWLASKTVTFRDYLTAYENSALFATSTKIIS